MRADKAKSEVRRKQITRAALKLLALRGWQNVSLSAIATEVGVVPSDVYRHFKGKDEVLTAVLDLVDQNFQDNLEAAHRDSTDPVESLHQVLARHAGMICGGIPIPRIVLSEEVFSGRGHHRKRVHEIYQKYLDGISRFIRQAQKEGRIRRELPVETLSLMWLGLVQSPAILWLLSRRGFDLPAHCEKAWRLFLESIQSAPSGRRA